MDALIKPLRPTKPSDVKSPDSRPAELDPSEFLAAAVRADQPRPSRAEAEAAVQTLLGYIGENSDREGLLDTPRRVVEAVAADRYLCPPPADPGAPHRPDRRCDRRGIKTPRRCRDDRGGAYLYVGARRRQAWRDDVHQPLYRHVPRQSGGAGAFPVDGARTEPVASLKN